MKRPYASYQYDYWFVSDKSIVEHSTITGSGKSLPEAYVDYLRQKLDAETAKHKRRSKDKELVSTAIELEKRLNQPPILIKVNIGPERPLPRPLNMEFSLGSSDVEPIKKSWWQFWK